MITASKSGQSWNLSSSLYASTYTYLYLSLHDVFIPLRTIYSILHFLSVIKLETYDNDAKRSTQCYPFFTASFAARWAFSLPSILALPRSVHISILILYSSNSLVLSYIHRASCYPGLTERFLTRFIADCESDHIYTFGDSIVFALLLVMMGVQEASQPIRQGLKLNQHHIILHQKLLYSFLGRSFACINAHHWISRRSLLQCCQF